MYPRSQSSSCTTAVKKLKVLLPHFGETQIRIHTSFAIRSSLDPDRFWDFKLDQICTNNLGPETLVFFLFMFKGFCVYIVYLCRPPEASTWYCVIRGGYPPQDWQSLPCTREELDSNPGLLICSQVRYHWATSPPDHLSSSWNTSYLWSWGGGAHSGECIPWEQRWANLL